MDVYTLFKFAVKMSTAVNILVHTSVPPDLLYHSYLFFQSDLCFITVFSSKSRRKREKGREKDRKEGRKGREGGKKKRKETRYKRQVQETKSGFLTYFLGLF